MSQMPPAKAQRARENSAYVRELLRRRQPGFAAALASAEQYLAYLLAEVAEERPLIRLVDDEQWLDRASAQTPGFVARRLAAETVGLVFATRVLSGELEGLPELACGACWIRACPRVPPGGTPGIAPLVRSAYPHRRGERLLS